jgi:hypothetical protein
MGEEGKSIKANITGDVSGQVAIGDQNVQSQSIVEARLSKEEAEELAGLFATLRDQVAAEAPPEAKEEAMERVAELEDAVTAKEPDISAMEKVKGWFAESLPKLGKAVSGMILHPLVAKLVGAAGDAVAGEFRRRFGG